MSEETTEQRWAARVAGWRASGLTARAYSEGKGFTAGGLRHWAHRLKQRGAGCDAHGAAAVRLLRVEQETAPLPTLRPASMTIELGEARVSIPAGFDASTVRTVLECLVARGGG